MDESEGSLRPDMSVVPYDNHRDVVLRNANSIVYRDPVNKQLIRLDPRQKIDVRADRPGECPACHRPWVHESTSQNLEDGMPDLEEQPTFIDTNYFRMLAQSLPGSAQPSAPPSPRRRLAQPVRARPVPAHDELPSDAEFVGTSPAPPGRGNGISEAAFAPKYFERFFVVEKELGRGGRGVVLLVKHVLDKVTLGHFACKRVPIGDDHSWLEKVLVEVQLLQTLSHQNLVSYRHVWLEDYQLNTFGPSVPCAFILQQYCNGGDLHNFVCGSALASTTTQDLKERLRRRSRGEAEAPRKPDEPKKLQFDEIYQFFRDITAGLRFLHLNKFVHRDLKPSNCLLHTAGGETRVLVSDFGEVQYEYATRKSTGATGTISYCAPEVLQRVSPDGPFGNFTFKSDIFSLGMILHFLCFADLPYHFADVLHEEREDVEQLRSEIAAWQGFDQHRKLRPELPDKLYSFLRRLLSLNPDNRPTADEVNQGIRTGGLEEPPEPHRKSSMSSVEELTPGRRVQPVDSPRRERSPSTTTTSGLSRLLPPHLRQRPKHRDAPTLDGQMDGNNRPDPVESDDAPRSPHPQDIVVRPKTSSALPSPRPEPSPPPRSPLLLPAPTRSRRFDLRILDRQIQSPLVRLSILLIKVLSTLHPCTSRSVSVNPTLAYPLLVFAIAEVTVYPRLRIWQTGLSLLAYLTVVYAGVIRGTMCGARLIDDVGSLQWENG